MRVGVIDASEQHVFKRESLAAFQSLFERLRRRHQFVDIPTLIDRHQLVSLLIGWSGKRDGEIRPTVELCEFVYFRNDAGGRNRYPTRYDKQTVLIRHYLESSDKVFEIEERLSRTHRHEIRSMRRLAPDAVHVIEDDDDLFDDLAGRQVSQQTELCR